MNLKKFIEYHNSIIIRLGFNIFLITVILLLLDQLSILNVNSIVNLNWLSFIGISSGTFSFILWQEKLNGKRKNRYKNIIKFLFLFFLLLITINSLDFKFLGYFIDLYTPNQILFLYLITIALGIITFWQNRKVMDKIGREKIVEEKKEKKKKINFTKVHPKMNSIPILKHLLKWMYKEGWLYVLGLILLFLLFTAIKLPYFDLSFTGQNSMKYAAYVEPAKYMYELNNPLHSQKKYMSDPVQNLDGRYLKHNEGIYAYFDSLPLMEWGLLFTYKLFPKNSLEFNTRLFTNFLGIILLFFIYIYFKYILNKKLSLIITALMTINPILNLISYLTVYDTIIYIFFFISLILFERYYMYNNIKKLFLSGLMGGVGIAIKPSLAFIIVPLFFTLIIFREGFMTKKFYRISLVHFPPLIIPYILVNLSLISLPSDPILSIIKFIVLTAILILTYIFIIKTNRIILKPAINFISQNKILSIVLLISAILVLGNISLYFKKEVFLVSRFLTDSSLIFNFGLYKYMLFEQFRFDMTENIFLLGFLGIIVLLIAFKFSNYKINTVLGFIIGAAFYWIIASKSIFFHRYYTLGIILPFIIFSGIILYLTSNLFKNKIASVFILLVLLSLLIPSSFNSTNNLLNKEIPGVEEAGEYVKKVINPNELFIVKDQSFILSLYGNRASFNMDRLDTEVFKNEVKKSSFYHAAKKYNVTYYITSGGEPDYLSLVNLFSNDFNLRTTYRRSDLIKEKLNQGTYFSDLEKRKEFLNKHDLTKYFNYENRIGSFLFYKIINPDENEMSLNESST